MEDKILAAIREGCPETVRYAYYEGLGEESKEDPLHLEHLLRTIGNNTTTGVFDIWVMKDVLQLVRRASNYGILGQLPYDLTLSLEDNLKASPELVELLAEVLDIK